MCAGLTFVLLGPDASLLSVICPPEGATAPGAGPHPASRFHLVQMDSNTSAALPLLKRWPGVLVLFKGAVH